MTNKKNTGNILMGIMVPLPFKRALSEYAQKNGYGNITALIRPAMYTAMLNMPGFDDTWAKYEKSAESDLADITKQIEESNRG